MKQTVDKIMVLLESWKGYFVKKDYFKVELLSF